MAIFDVKRADAVRLIAMDLDGTLTQHKTPLSEEARAALDALAKRHTLLMVGAGQAMRIFNQMGQYPLDIIGNYGMQEAHYDSATATLRIVRDDTAPCDRPSVDARVTALRERYGFTEFAGDNVEYHPSGCVTFPILGTKAVAEDKLAFDPDRRRRRAIYREVVEAFPEYTVFVGGSSSFDMAPHPHDKYHALATYCAERGIPHSAVLFIGDDYGMGGNDEAVYLSDIPFLTVDDYRDFPRLVAPLL